MQLFLEDFTLLFWHCLYTYCHIFEKKSKFSMILSLLPCVSGQLYFPDWNYFSQHQIISNLIVRRNLKQNSCLQEFSHYRFVDSQVFTDKRNLWYSSFFVNFELQTATLLQKDLIAINFGKYFTIPVLQTRHLNNLIFCCHCLYTIDKLIWTFFTFISKVTIK